MELLFLYLSLALSVSFLCSLLEASLLSVSVGHVNAQAELGHAGARLMRKFKDQPDKPLAAILSLNTVAHTVGAAGVGAQVVHIWGDAWLGLASGLLTIAILLLTEILPKTLGSLHAARLIGFTARTVQVMIVLLYPLVLAAELMGRLASGPRKTVQVSRAEVAAVADMGVAGGTLTPGEATTIRNLLALRTIHVTDIMTPRPVVQFVHADQTVGELVASARQTTFARMPVTDGDIDHVIGMIHRSMILDAVRHDQLNRTFRTMARPVTAVPEAATAAEAFEKVLKQREHMLLVVDEYGGTAGVVTMEDVVETMLGVEIVDETDPTVDMRELARKLQQQRLQEHAARESPLEEAH
jgi:CBS domain containing-hemolysin-like protein